MSTRGTIIALALTAATLAFVLALAGCGGDDSPYDIGYDQGVQVSNVSEDDVPTATGDRCRDLSLAWYVGHQVEDGLSTDDQHEFERGCRAGLEGGS